jgi:hypothetical protein
MNGDNYSPNPVGKVRSGGSRDTLAFCQLLSQEHMITYI